MVKVKKKKKTVCITSLDSNFVDMAHSLKE